MFAVILACFIPPAYTSHEDAAQKPIYHSFTSSIWWIWFKQDFERERNIPSNKMLAEYYYYYYLIKGVKGQDFKYMIILLVKKSSLPMKDEVSIEEQFPMFSRSKCMTGSQSSHSGPKYLCHLHWNNKFNQWSHLFMLLHIYNMSESTCVNDVCWFGVCVI